jgi:ubiquinone/menaquinone biosynthesis C-methylase UbiE
MRAKFDPKMKDRLLSEERYDLLRPDQLLRDLDLKPGDTLADIGCGPGFFTVPAAEIVGKSGRVLAADIQGEMLAALRSRVQEHELVNVRLVKTSETEIPLQEGCADLALVAFTLHEVEQRARFLHQVRRALKSAGRLAVIEWEPGAEGMGPPSGARLSPDEVIKDAEAAGLRLAERRALSDQHYLLVLVPITR